MAECRDATVAGPAADRFRRLEQAARERIEAELTRAQGEATRLIREAEERNARRRRAAQAAARGPAPQTVLDIARGRLEVHNDPGRGPRKVFRGRHRTEGHGAAGR